MRYRFLTCIFFTLMFLIPCILFNVGVGREWNKNAIMSKCLVIDHNIIESKCSYKCNCQIVCLEKPFNCYNICNLCWKTCYNGYVNVLINNTENRVSVLTDDNITNVESQLNKKYSINITITCYYYNNITKFSNEEENSNYFVFYIISTIVACLISLIVLSLEIYLCCKGQIDLL